MSKVCGDKQCRRKGQRLRLSEFPVDRSRGDGLYVYCKECCRRRSYSGRPKRDPIPKVAGDPLSLVYSEIQHGPKTREDIRSATRLSFDQIGDALVVLVWECKVATVREGLFSLIDSEALAA